MGKRGKSSFPANKGFFAGMLEKKKQGKKAKAKAKRVQQAIFGSAASKTKKQQPAAKPVIHSSSSSTSSRERNTQQEELVVAGGDVLADLVLKGALSNPNPRSAGSFGNSDRILLVGEGSFSFAESLSTTLGGSNLVATSLDSKREVLKKYESAAANALASLKAAGARVYHEIDATKEEDLKKCLGEWKSFDIVAFNFPHLGGGTQEAILANQDLIRGFFAAAQTVLRVPTEASKDVKQNRQERMLGGQIHITLRSSEFYDKWNIVSIGKEQGMRLLRKEPFNKDNFKGYEEVRTNPAFRASPEVHSAFTHIFVRDIQQTVDIPHQPQAFTTSSPSTSKVKKRTTNSKTTRSGKIRKISST